MSISGLSPTSTADDNTVMIKGNYDPVTLVGVSDRNIVITGNLVDCMVTSLIDTCS